MLKHEMDKDEKTIFIVVKNFKEKGPGKWFGCFLFFNHSSRWFLVVPPKDGFAHILSITNKLCSCTIHLLKIYIKFKLTNCQVLSEKDFQYLKFWMGLEICDHFNSIVVVDREKGGRK